VSIPGGAPTGQVFNPTPGFVVSSGTASGPAVFLFNSEGGQVTGWNPGVPPPPPSTQAQVGASVPDAIYTGLALASTPAGTFLYAADFHNGRIDVFDSNFNLVQLPGSFSDDEIPAGFAPFNVQTLGGRLYVAYAKQDADREDEVAGPSLGFVDVYDLSGNLLRHLIERGQLDAPWGLALAPAGFGRFGGTLLVGNFGNGRINAYDPRERRVPRPVGFRNSVNVLFRRFGSSKSITLRVGRFISPGSLPRATGGLGVLTSLG
jgi:uncharacterized protein (TIGR03118 family)